MDYIFGKLIKVMLVFAFLAMLVTIFGIGYQKYNQFQELKQTNSQHASQSSDENIRMKKATSMFDEVLKKPPTEIGGKFMEIYANAIEDNVITNEELNQLSLVYDKTLN